MSDYSELDLIEESIGMDQCSLTLIFRDSGDFGIDTIGKTGGKIMKSFAFKRVPDYIESPKEHRELLVEEFRRFLVACGYPSDYTMEPGYKKDKE
tara:strand:- start:86 stop:370 length:285 start_codon:yes stop_codon:yes gene_type:complete